MINFLKFFKRKVPNFAHPIHHSHFFYKFSDHSDAARKMSLYSDKKSFIKLIDYLIDKFPNNKIPHYDYPFLYHLVQLKNKEDIKYIFNDIGGSFGLHFNAVQKCVPSIIDSWNIYEEKNTYQIIKNFKHDPILYFHENVYKYNDCDVLYCSGTLQYLDFKNPKELIIACEKKPKYIFFNQLPLDINIDNNIYTLQNIFESIVINTVFPKDKFIKSVESCGYQLIDEWNDFSAGCNIINGNYSLPHYTGQFYKLV